MSIKKIFSFFGWPLLALPIAVLWVGIACNGVATGFNHAVMPVQNPICATEPDRVGDGIHTCATADTKVKFLIDRFPANGGVVSIGDILQSEHDVLYEPCYILWATIGFFCLIRKREFYLE